MTRHRCPRSPCVYPPGPSWAGFLFHPARVSSSGLTPLPPPSREGRFKLASPASGWWSCPCCVVERRAVLVRSTATTVARSRATPVRAPALRTTVIGDRMKMYAPIHILIPDRGPAVPDLATRLRTPPTGRGTGASGTFGPSARWRRTMVDRGERPCTPSGPSFAEMVEAAKADRWKAPFLRAEAAWWSACHAVVYYTLGWRHPVLPRLSRKEHEAHHRWFMTQIRPGTVTIKGWGGPS